jgi:hypothetical protein
MSLHPPHYAVQTGVETWPKPWTIKIAEAIFEGLDEPE